LFYGVSLLCIFQVFALTAVVVSKSAAAASNENDYNDYPAATIVSKHFIVPSSAHN